jgi:hypothetical protein
MLAKFSPRHFHEEKRDSLVGIATGYGLEGTRAGVRVDIVSRISSSPLRPDRIWGPTSLLFNGYKGIYFPRIKWPDHETDHLLPTNVKLKKMCISTFTPIYAFMA